MTPENWPEPIGRVVELSSLEAVDIHVEEMPPVGESIYTAAQVREIVRIEVEQLRNTLSDVMTTYDGCESKMVEIFLKNGIKSLDIHPEMVDQYVAAAKAREAARKWLKENKDA